MGNASCCKEPNTNSEEKYEPLAVQIVANDNANNNEQELIAKVDQMEQNMTEMREQIQQLDEMVKLLLNERRGPNNHSTSNNDEKELQQEEEEEEEEELKEQMPLIQQQESVASVPDEGEAKQDIVPGSEPGVDEPDANINIINVECNGVIAECGYLQRLKIKMASDNDQGTDLIVEDLFHLVNEHPGDNEFHFIYNALGGQCQDAVSCEPFSRNHRARDKLKNNDHLNALYHVDAKDITIPNQQIRDRVHCHYRHCYDIGNRLPLDIQTQINEEMLMDQKYDDYEGESFSYFVNSQFKRVNEAHADKYQTFRDIRRLNESNKFMMSAMDPVDDDDDDLKEESNLYSFGFRYVYQQDHHWKKTEQFPWYIGYAPLKYDSFKQELVSNDIFTITIEQFDNELTKAMLYFERYTKSEFAKNWCARNSHITNGDCFSSEPDFCVEHVLSAMMYCNYDLLQYELSKTYRRVHKNESKDDVLKRHRNYHHLGRYLSEMVFHGGIDANHRSDEDPVLYHGISKDLVLTDPRLANIFSPLSATPSIAVAANFSNPNGIIIEFEPRDGRKDRGYIRSTYLNCAPLSDFGNEREFLFVQSGYALQIKNVIVASTAVEYRQLLNGIGLIESCYSTNYIPKYLQTVHDQLIQHELHKCGNVNDFTAWDGLDEYPEKMMHQYCIRKHALDVYIDKLGGNPLFVDDKNWIKLDVLNALFPNLKVVKIDSNPIIRLTKTMMNSVLEHVQKKKYNKLQTIEIKISQIGFNSQSAINSFSELFENSNFTMSVPRSFDPNERGDRGGGYGRNMHNRGVTDRTKNYDILMISKIE